MTKKQAAETFGSLHNRNTFEISDPTFTSKVEVSVLSLLEEDVPVLDVSLPLETFGFRMDNGSVET